MTFGTAGRSLHNYTYTYIALLLIYLAADYEQLIRQSGRHRVSHE